MVTPPIFSGILRDALWCTTNNVLMKSPKRVVAESYEPWEFDSPSSWLRSPFDATLCHRTPEPETLGGFVTAFRSIRTSFYHSLLENIPRMALLHHPAYAALERIEVLIDGAPSAVEKYYMDRLLPGNCVVREVKPKAVYRVEQFILLSHVTYRNTDGQHPACVAFLRERACPSRPSRKDRRILISRRSSSRGRRITNADDLIASLAPHGFVEYALENMSIKEQIELFYDAEIVVAPHGAGLANLLYAPPGTRVVELFANDVMAPHYYFLSKSLGLNYSHILGTQPRLDADFEVDIARLSALL